MTAHRYNSEISDRARRRAVRRLMAEPEPTYDDNEWSPGFLFTFSIAAGLFAWMLIVLVAIAWSAK